MYRAISVLSFTALLSACNFTFDIPVESVSETSQNEQQIPTAVTNLNSHWYGERLLVSWDNDDARANYFEVRYRDPLLSWQPTLAVDADLNWVEIPMSEQISAVEVKVRAANSYGESDWSSLTITNPNYTGSNNDQTDNTTDNNADNGSNNSTDNDNSSDTDSGSQTDNGNDVVSEPLAELIAPVAGTELEAGDTVTFEFNRNNALWLDIGETVNGSEFLSTAVNSAHYTFTIPTMTSELHVTLWTLINGQWGYRNYQFSVQQPVDNGNGNGNDTDSNDSTDDTGSSDHSKRPEFAYLPGEVVYHTLNENAVEAVQLYTGRNDGNGVDLVVVAEGYTQAELPKFISDVQSLIQEAFDFHPLDAHMAGWNIHVLSLASAQSGADNANYRGELVDTRLGANFWCGNTERLLCIDSRTVTQEVARFVPQYDEILVLVNTTKYGGAGYSQGIATASLASAAVNLIRHEIAHSFAGLADEYTYGRSNPPVYEPAAANATLVSNPTQVKWHHWMNDPSSVVINQGTGIGLWEGAVYYSSGVYRPAQSSLMKVLGAPFREVNSEAWALAVYDYIDPILSSVPTTGAVQLALGSSQWFALEALYRADDMKVEWRLNDQAISPSADNPYDYRFTPSRVGQYRLDVTVTDNTGIIRRDLNTRASQTFSWTITVQ